MYNLIKAPLTTEKNTGLQAQSTYVFKVEKKATKKQIAKAVEQLFDVKVMGVRTCIARRRRQRNLQRRRAGENFSKVYYWKKAFVKLSPGHKIRMFEGA